MIKQTIILIILSILLSVVANSISPENISWIGEYREISDGDGPIVPPSAEAGDPPFIDINIANIEFATKTSIFVDARDHEEFICGTIPGSISIPFEYMPDELEGYFETVLADVSLDYSIIVFCSGEECDLSLHLARNMQDLGYTGLKIFFGGAREWDNAGFELERREECDQ